MKYILIGFLLFLTSCCPKIRVADTITERVDTMYIPVIDTVTISVIDTFSTGLLIDSLLEFLNKPINNTTLSQNNSGGVRTRIVYRDKYLVAEFNIDSLRAAIKDSVIQVVKSREIIRNTYIQECPVGWWKWVHWPIGLFAIAGFMISTFLVVKAIK